MLFRSLLVAFRGDLEAAEECYQKAYEIRRRTDPESVHSSFVAMVTEIVPVDEYTFDIKTKAPAVVVLTASQDEDDLIAAARLGARGIVLKAMAPRVLEDCIRTVHAGRLSLSVNGMDLSDRLAQRQNVETELQNILTPREFEILRLVAARLDNQEIAARLSISVGTVKIHLHHVFDKLQLRGRHDLQMYLREKMY